jgi:hypothetical protein
MSPKYVTYKTWLIRQGICAGGESDEFRPGRDFRISRTGVLDSYLPESDKRILPSDLAAYPAPFQDEIMQDDLSATSNGRP